MSLTRRQRRAGRTPGPATTPPKPRSIERDWLQLWAVVGKHEARKARQLGGRARRRAPSVAFLAAVAASLG